MAAVDKQKRIADPVLAVLAEGTCAGTRYLLPGQQLDRKMYEAVNDVLAALGGKWNRSAKAHVFASDCAPLLESAIETGTFCKPGDMGWFPTPQALAVRVVAQAKVSAGDAVLEPSAGLGAIAFEALKRRAIVTCVEIDAGRAAKLRESFSDVREGDFLAQPVQSVFDRCVMNPPFAARADIRHVLHARQFLKPGGLLVAIMSGSVAFRTDRLTDDFRRQCLSVEQLPEGSFKDSGTAVNTVMVTIRREG